MTHLSPWRKWIKIAAATGLAGAALLGAQQHVRHRALRAALGPEASVSRAQWYWRSGAGRLEHLSMPLGETPATTAGSRPSRLDSEQVWFTWDARALLQKRLVFPSVVLSEVEVRLEEPPRESRFSEPLNAVGREWLAPLRRQWEHVSEASFRNELASVQQLEAVQTQWTQAFAAQRQSVDSLLIEAQTLRADLDALDNPLRHAEIVREGLKQLDRLAVNLDAMLMEINAAERLMPAERQRVEELLRRDQRALEDAALVFTASPPNSLAGQIIGRWMEQVWQHRAAALQHVDTLVRQPRVQSPQRGEEFSFGTSSAPQWAAPDVKLAGKLVSRAGREPFTGLASFQQFDRSGDGTSVPYPREVAMRGNYQLTLGDPLRPAVLKGQFDGRAADKVLLQWSEEDWVRARLTSSLDGLHGDMQVALRNWLVASPIRVRGALSSLPISVETALRSGKALTYSPLDDLGQLLEQAVAGEGVVPQQIRVRIGGTWKSPAFTVHDADTQWLANALSEQAALRMREEYAEGTRLLEEDVQRRLDGFQQLVAVAQHDVQQHIQRTRMELVAIRTDIQQLAQRGEVNYARRPNADTAR
jgi:hypothetical protein